jgi:hypothetical protein
MKVRCGNVYRLIVLTVLPGIVAPVAVTPLAATV